MRKIRHPAAFRGLPVCRPPVGGNGRACLHRGQSVCFFKDYGFDLDETTVELLEIESAEDVEVMAILTIEEPFEKSTANLMAPIVVNRKKCSPNK